ncbi:hypothetical protein Tco_1318550 [Tanacetum coccineum]
MKGPNDIELKTTLGKRFKEIIKHEESIVSEINLMDKQTLFIFKIEALSEKTPEALRLVKILNGELGKRDDKEPMGITESEVGTDGHY